MDPGKRNLWVLPNFCPSIHLSFIDRFEQDVTLFSSGIREYSLSVTALLVAMIKCIGHAKVDYSVNSLNLEMHIQASLRLVFAEVVYQTTE